MFQKKMKSLLKNWNNIRLRNSILLFSLEEANYYEPTASLSTKAFVVCTIRNSLLETAGSDFYQNHDFEKQLTDEEIKKITMQAVRYFKNVNLEQLSKEFQNVDDDYYNEIHQNYPEAFIIIEKLANLKGKELYFEKLSISKKIIILPDNRDSKIKEDSVIEDGVSPYFNQKLCTDLNNAILNKDIGFFTDSFKLLTRSYEKLLKTIQYLLENDSKFLTFNYYISNGYIARRLTLLRPVHDLIEFKNKFIIKKELASKHKTALDKIKKIIG